MPEAKKKPLSLDELIDLEYQLHLDEKEDRQSLRERDRKLRLEMDADPEDRRALFLAWLDRVMDRGESSPGQMIAGLVSVLSAVLGLLGFLIGLGAAMGVFAYTGQTPVNVINVLAVFVGLQLLLLVAWLGAIVPPKWIAWLPGARAMQDLVRMLSPGRLVPFLARFFSHSKKESLASAWGQFKAFDQMYGRVRFWLLLRSSQVFAIAFQLGALVGCMWLIAFSDLAFAWSTTLRVEPEHLYQLGNIISRPWAWFWPQAVPSRELVEITEFFRYADAKKDLVDPKKMGGWWPFLIACMLLYGLIPRIITYWVARWRYAASLRKAPLNHAAFQELHERLTEPLVETSTGLEREIGDEGRGDGGEGPTLATVAGKRSILIQWGEQPFSGSALAASVAQRFQCPPPEMWSAGGLDVADDAKCLTAAKGADSDTSIILAVKAWEPPTRDLTQFIEKLRKAAGKEVPIIVMPVDEGEDASCDGPEKADLEHWSGKMRALGDPWLRTANIAGEA
ncbi:MAG: DUF2868 domain-containing protein [Candidatus Sumerlaeia bacterium]